MIRFSRFASENTEEKEEKMKRDQIRKSRIKNAQTCEREASKNNSSVRLGNDGNRGEEEEEEEGEIR